LAAPSTVLAKGEYMPTHRALFLLPAALASFATPTEAQRILQSVAGTRVGGALGQTVRAAGDVDGDGIVDLLVTEPSYATNGGDGQGRVHLVSGATRSDLWTFLTPLAYDVTGIRDVNGDNHRDVVVSRGFSQLQVVSGATGQVLFSVGSATVPYSAVCDVGDVNGDGRGDFAALVQRATLQVDIISGNGGAVLGTLTGLTFFGSYTPALRTFVDVTNDGRPEFLVSNGRDAVYLCSPAQPQLLRTIPSPNGAHFGMSLGAADVDGDGIPEILIEHEGISAPGAAVVGIEAVSAATGQIVRTFLPELAAGSNQPGLHQACSAGDLDGDGAADIATIEATGPYLRIDFLSGSTGRLLAHLDGSAAASYFHLSDFSAGYLDAMGDVDGDGFHDIACGTLEAGFGADRGGFQVISGRILADVAVLGGACGAGPFFPQLGMTRPILGQTTAIACRDGAPGVPCGLAISLPPPLPIYLGASTCTAFFDVGNWVSLLTTTQPQWTLQIRVPGAPQLAGLAVALQAFYVPTAGPLGFDLSNGLEARLGY
jgi:hypothetical protein